MSGKVHIIGAGLAGLTAAVRLSAENVAVDVYEAAPVAGGRCRTFHDPRLDRDVDNGNHLILSGNHAVLEYARVTGGAEHLQTAPTANFQFVDIFSDERWAVELDDGPFPTWVLREEKRIPGTRLTDYFDAVRLALAGASATVAQAVRPRGMLWTRFWQPLSWAVLNTTPERGAARLLRRAMSETFLRGGRFCRPIFAPNGLGKALVDPAVQTLGAKGVGLEFGHALSHVETTAGRIVCLRFTNRRTVDVGPNDRVILALPPTRLKAVLPWMKTPRDDASVLNVHFLVPGGALTDKPSMIGLINATSHWAFTRGDVLSLTVSAADRLGVMNREPSDLLPELWREASAALGLGDITYTAARINKERRATMDQSPEQVALRPKPRTAIRNLFLAGDATDTKLPATLEGAVRSGLTAARLAA
ncbi:MAG: hydroxysqualene dehydroxylase HpnE [Pseudomonadota bacterium]